MTAEAKAPQELREEDIQRSENETAKNVAEVQKLLEQKGQMNFFKFVINPDDFAQSVENIFYLSFGIRDGHIAFEIQDGEPVVCESTYYLCSSQRHSQYGIVACDSPDDADYQGGLKKQQMVLEFDMAVWKVFEFLRPDDCALTPFPARH